MIKKSNKRGRGIGGKPSRAVVDEEEQRRSRSGVEGVVAVDVGEEVAAGEEIVADVAIASPAIKGT